MFYNNAFPGKIVKEFTFEPALSSALPSWLTATGTSPVFTYGTLADRGAMRFQTKVATPTSGDQAGFNTVNIDPTKYSEVGYFLTGLMCDSAALTDCTFGFQWSNGSTQGFYMQHDYTTSETRTRIYPAASEGFLSGTTKRRWQFNRDFNGAGTNDNASRLKEIGFVMRATGELFITSGDPYEGGGVLCYDSVVWPTTALPIQFYLITRTAAQRYGEVSRIKLRLVQP